MAWHLEQVREFNNSRGNHAQVAQVLESVLNEITRRTDPTAIVQVRPKSLASFSEKANRKKNKYSNPVQQLTDVVGGRIITYTQAAADKVCRLIEDLGLQSLLIDWDNSINTADRLKPEEFGYNAMHFVVQLKPPKVLGLRVDNWVFPYKVEIQVCTMMQHVWAAIGHDRVYKTRLRINDSLKRRLSAISALIETAQAEFENGIVTLDRYSEGFAAHLDADDRQAEETIWQSVIDVEPFEYDAYRKLGDYYASQGEWQKAFDQYSKCDESLPTVLAKRGRAAARLGKTDEAENSFRKAVDKDKADWSARCDLAELLYKRLDFMGALRQYREAFEAAPSEPRALLRYVTAIVCQEGSLSCATALRGALDAAIEENKRRVELNVDLPNAFLQTGRCHLFRGDVYPALDAYCKGSLACESLDPIEAERSEIAAVVAKLRPQERSPDAGTADPRVAFECAEKLLHLLSVVVSRRLRMMHGHPEQAEAASAQPDVLSPAQEERRLETLATRAARPAYAKRPVVIVAGGCDQNVDERIKTYRQTIQGAFANFTGTIICGGTTAGISGLIGEVAKKRGSDVAAIGYLPSVANMLAGDVRDDVNYRVAEVAGGIPGYSAIGPIQTWADLLLAGVEPATVRLLGINGGVLSGVEFRLAMALGATVGLIEDSGRAVSTLLTDPDWRRLGRLAALLNEAATIAPFVSAFCPTFEAIESPKERQQKLEELARAKHEGFRASRLAKKDHVHPSILPWDQGLDDTYKKSNRQQAAYGDRILRTEGFAIALSNDPRPAVDFRDSQYSKALDRMAQLEHGRFNAERLAEGWQYGSKRDLAAKTSPYLVSWHKLTEEIQRWDRDPFLKLPELLEPLGLKVVRLD